MPAGAYITIGILIAVVFLILYAAISPKIKRYRFEIKRVEPKKKKRRSTRKPTKKKKKTIWIKVI